MNKEECEKCGYLLENHKVGSGKCPEITIETEELYECQECGDMTPDKGICFMCKETIIK